MEQDFHIEDTKEDGGKLGERVPAELCRRYPRPQFSNKEDAAGTRDSPQAIAGENPRKCEGHSDNEEGVALDDVYEDIEASGVSTDNVFSPAPVHTWHVPIGASTYSLVIPPKTNRDSIELEIEK